MINHDMPRPGDGGDRRDEEYDPEGPSTAELRAALDEPDHEHDCPLGFPVEGTQPSVTTPSTIAVARLLKRVTRAVEELRGAVESGTLADGPERSDAWHVYNLARALRQTIADRATRVRL